MTLAEGTKAPNFSLPDQDGNEVALKDFSGKNVVLYFYPKDMTPGCTTQATAFRDEYATFKKANAVILGVSKDSSSRHTKFIEKYNLPFTLLADEDGDVCEMYGVWAEKKLYGKVFMGIVRTTFIIDSKGLIRNVFPKVKVKGHADAVLAALAEL